MRYLLLSFPFILAGCQESDDANQVCRQALKMLIAQSEASTALVQELADFVEEFEKRSSAEGSEDWIAAFDLARQSVDEWQVSILRPSLNSLQTGLPALLEQCGVDH